jgi:hypothetical protein
MRIRWEWLRRTDHARPWQGLPMIKDAQAREAFDSLVHIQVGIGSEVLFWRDRWIHGRSASEYAPGITQHISTRAKMRGLSSKHCRTIVGYWTSRAMLRPWVQENAFAYG